jgi:hypothetical protein
MSLADSPRRSPMWQRLFFLVPIIGWVARDLIHGDESNIWYAIVLFVSLWLIAILLFGVPGLYIPAVLMVPVIFGFLILITWA